jgi:hypothetical protein
MKTQTSTASLIAAADLALLGFVARRRRSCA